MRRDAKALSAVLGLLICIGALYASSALAVEAGCPNQVFRTGAGANLPDCRAYEQATPVDKHGSNSTRDINLIQASADGNRINFGNSAGLPTTGGSSSAAPFLASRGTGAWTTNGILPLISIPGRRAQLLGWDEEFDSVANAVTRIGLYRSDTATGTYELVVPVSTGFFPVLAGYAADPANLIFESENVLDPAAVAGRSNLYEVDHGVLSAVGLIPPPAAISCGEEAGPACVPTTSGSVAGPYNWEESEPENGGSSGRFFTQNTISDDGAKIFFTALESGQLYVREDGTATTWISASPPGTPDPNGPKPAAFLDATPSGSRVFFSSCERLTADSTAVSVSGSNCDPAAGQGSDLYMYDTESKELTDLTVDANASDLQGARVVGFVGASDDGDDVYFVADGVLADGATPGECAVSFSSVSCNLYLYHDEEVSFVTSLHSDAPLGVELRNWKPRFNADAFITKESRVADDGTLLFTSTHELTGYDSRSPVCSSSVESRCPEYFRFDPETEELTCVSCNPSGATPVGPPNLAPNLESQAVVSAERPRSSFLTRNISADGKRIFFNSPDPLVAADSNGVTDPYEWEAPGAGSCPLVEAEGCLYLLSSGKSPEPSFLGDISSSGDDAFIFTDESFVPADKDELIDVYDARVGGGLSSQYPAPLAPPCASAEACGGAATLPPNQLAAATATFSGPGNRKGKPSKRCRKGTKKCRKSSKGKHKKHKSRAAHTNRGGSK